MLTLAQIALHVDGVIIGDAECEISNVSTLQAANRQQISFLANSKYKKYLITLILILLTYKKRNNMIVDLIKLMILLVW